MARLYTRDELSELYKEYTANNMEVITEMIKKTLVPFVVMDIITSREKKDWLEEDSDASYSRVLSRVQERNDLDMYIKFSRCLAFLNKQQVDEVYRFVPDLMEVGLHDPLRASTEVNLTPRVPSQMSNPVVLWIVKDEVMFNFCNTLTRGERLSTVAGYELRKSTAIGYLDLYVVHSKEKPRAPGRRFNQLLAKFERCPSLLVYSGECQPGQGDPELVSNSVVLVSSPSSSFDYTAEASHVTELCRLGGDSYLSNVSVHIRAATKYAPQGGSNVHCPDAASLFYAASKCEIPAVAIAQVQASDEERNNRDNSHCTYVYELIKKLLH